VVNTLLEHCAHTHFFNRKLRIDRVGPSKDTSIEKLFGYIRMDANDINSCEEMTRTISHTDLAKEAYHLLELEEVVPGRANLAGIYLDEQLNNAITYHIETADPVPRSHRGDLSQNGALPACCSQSGGTNRISPVHRISTFVDKGSRCKPDKE
jgi:hypothetical protein